MQISDKIKKIKLSDIKPYKNNPRIHSAKQILQIKSSIEDNQYIVPIILDKHNEIICGHGRFEALKQLYKQTELIEVIDGSHLTPKQVKKLRIADNKIQENSEWNTDLLEQEIQSIYDNGHFEDAVNEIGFNNIFLDNIINGFNLEKSDYNKEINKFLGFKQDDIKFYKHIIIRFLKHEDYNKFCKLIKQRLTEKTKAIWFPKQDFNSNNRDKKYE